MPIYTLNDVLNNKINKRYNIVRVLDERIPYTKEEILYVEDFGYLVRDYQLTWYEWFVTWFGYTENDIIIMRKVLKILKNKDNIKCQQIQHILGLDTGQLGTSKH